MAPHSQPAVYWLREYAGLLSGCTGGLRRAGHMESEQIFTWFRFVVLYAQPHRHFPVSRRRISKPILRRTLMTSNCYVTEKYRSPLFLGL